MLEPQWGKSECCQTGHFDCVVTRMDGLPEQTLEWRPRDGLGKIEIRVCGQFYSRTLASKPWLHRSAGSARAQNPRTALLGLTFFWHPGFGGQQLSTQPRSEAESDSREICGDQCEQSFGSCMQNEAAKELGGDKRHLSLLAQSRSDFQLRLIGLRTRARDSLLEGLRPPQRAVFPVPAATNRPSSSCGSCG